MKTLLLFGLLAVCLAAAEIPRPAPEISIALPGGKQVKSTDFKGDVIIVAFILST
jgi:hypothetical protein